MKPILSIPREALADLLRLAGSPLTPEEYVASLPQPDAIVYRKYASRAWAAAVSKYFLLVVAVLAVLGLPFMGFDVENIIVTIGLVTVTYFEFRVHSYFCAYNPAAPSLGFKNQTCFAAAIVIYCLYHGLATFQLSHDEMTLVEQNNLIDINTLKAVVRAFYLSIAIIAGGSQYALAWYYRSAEVKVNS